MPLINHAKGEINAKIVYLGPPAAGKATNLNHIFSKLKESFRGTFKSMNLQKDRMLFFDFTPSGQGSVNGYNIRFHIYTITGEVSQPSAWKMVLKGVDGIVFVADSAPDRMAANVESFREVHAALAAYGKSLVDIPCVIQCNKRDHSRALALEEMGRFLNAGDYPLVPAVAARGEGVLECIFSLVKGVLKNLRAGGLELAEEPEKLRRIAEQAEPARHEASPPVMESSQGAGTAVPAGPGEAPATPAESSPAPVDEAPQVEFAGEPELLDGGRVRLPLAIGYGGRVKRMTLDISLSPDE